MAENNQEISKREEWSSRLVFILAATGSAVGLGNVWKFPYIAGENGGGAFVLIYLVCIALLGIPIMMAEIMLGRRGRKDPINTMKHVADESDRSEFWGLLGWMGVIAGFIILSYYSVIAGWALAYVPRVAVGMFTGLEAEGVKSIFESLVSNPESLMAWHTLFMIMTMVVVARGVRRGLERAVSVLMPLLFILLVVLIMYSVQNGAFIEGASFLFSPDFSKITTDGVLKALGHAFFTLSLGMGAIMVYGSYLPRHTHIAHASITVALLDTLVALMAGLVIFPIVFANGLEPGAGPGLIFQTLPLAFGHMDFGTVFGAMFFVLLVFAAWTSSISLIEPAVTWIMDTYGLTRTTTAIILGILVWLMGLLTVFSFNILGDVTFTHIISTAWGEFVLFDKATIFDVLDYLTANIMLPLGGLLIAIFAGWHMRKEFSKDELELPAFLYDTWLFLVRFVAPVMVLIVFLNAVGVIDFVQNMFQ